MIVCRNVGGNFTSIPKYFLHHGYKSIGMGKIFHVDRRFDHNDFSAWSDYFYPPNYCAWQVFNASWIAVEWDDHKNHPFPDHQTAMHAVETLQKLAETPDEPFFMAVGFHKPHLPYTFPKEFLEYYPTDELQYPDNVWIPENMPKVAWYSYADGRQFQDLRTFYHMGELNRTFSPEVIMDMRRAYYSATSYSDYLLGLVMDELERSGLADDTIVSFVGDHGYQLGEHAEWTKETNFEIACHAPMMIHVPGVTDNGMVTEELVEFVDLFPTLVDLVGLPSMPLCPEDSSRVEVCREGTSMLPLFSNNSTNKWKKAAFSQIPRPVNTATQSRWMSFDTRNG